MTFSTKKTAEIKQHLSANLTFQNLLQNRKLLPAEKFGNILAFDKESKKATINYICRQFYHKQFTYVKVEICLTEMENHLISKKLNSDVMDFQLQ